ncbi:MAG: TlpA family protein disulfide reductase [Gemmatimonadales bacterium]|nr:MAG: TlpA family protein disulfide reductase [Gemmatimonadales bacterium]
MDFMDEMGRRDDPSCHGSILFLSGVARLIGTIKGPIRMRRSTHTGPGARGTTTIFFLSIALSASCLAAQTRIGIEIGSEPELFALETVDGEFVDLAEVLEFGPVLLQFWATWCPDCEALRPTMEAAHEEFGDRVGFYGVAVAVGQKQSTVRKHLQKQPLPFPMLWDARGHAVRQFMAPTTSYIVILDADGRVEYTGVGSKQDIFGALRRIVGDGQSPSESS